MKQDKWQKQNKTKQNATETKHQKQIKIYHFHITVVKENKR